MRKDDIRFSIHMSQDTACLIKMMLYTRCPQQVYDVIERRRQPVDTMMIAKEDRYVGEGKEYTRMAMNVE